MRTIDRTNYEAWLLDRLEGRLTPEEERSLDAFLAAHPDLGTDPGDLPVIGSGIVPFDEKHDLKRDLPPAGMPDLQMLDDYLVARLEGELSPAQEAALDELLKKDGSAARHWSLMQRARVSAARVTFSDKTGLKKSLPPQGLPTVEQLDDFLVARLEGELTPEQEAALGELLQNDATAARSWAIMQRTRVVPAAIVFPDKSD
jgi:anti-sigma factor RsiW